MENFSSGRDVLPYSRFVRWDRLFEDLEGQLASEWEAERAALDSEAERLRLSRLTLRERLATLAADRVECVLHVDEIPLAVTIIAIGADWLAATPAEGRGDLVVPLAAIDAFGLAHADVLRSARPRDAAVATLRDRMTLGFLLRDAARRRVPVRVGLAGGRQASGTIDRAGHDHLDLALHDAGTPRRAADVRGHRVIPFAAVRWVRFDEETVV